MMHWKATDTGGCDKIGDLLSAYFDGEVTADERSLVEEHLHDCEACRRAFDHMGKVNTLVTRVAAQEAPDERYWQTMSRSVMARVAALPQSEGRFPRVLRWRVPAFTSLAVAATILLALFVAQDRPTPHKASPVASVPTGGEPALTASAPPPARAESDAAKSRNVVREPIVVRSPAPRPPAPHELALAADAPVLQGASPQREDAKPARGGVEYLQNVASASLKAQSAARSAAVSEGDLAGTDLRAMELSLRKRLENSADTTGTAELRRDLAATLFQIADETRQPGDVTRALDFWRTHYDTLAVSLGDSTAAARLTRLETLLQRAVQPKPSE